MMRSCTFAFEVMNSQNLLLELGSERTLFLRNIFWCFTNTLFQIYYVKKILQGNN